VPTAAGMADPRNACLSSRSTLQDIPLDAIEPDAAQPRRIFDEEKLQSLAASIVKYGLLQELAVFAVAANAAGLPTRFRLIWGERRWRASRIAGLRVLRCKVLPRADDTAAEQLRTKEGQWAENMKREGLSPRCMIRNSGPAGFTAWPPTRTTESAIRSSLVRIALTSANASGGRRSAEGFGLFEDKPDLHTPEKSPFSCLSCSGLFLPAFSARSSALRLFRFSAARFSNNPFAIRTPFMTSPT
jgi:hypothetical protein